MRIPATLLSSITHRRPTTVPTQVQARLLSRTFTIGSYLSSQAQQGNNNIVSKMPSDVQNEVESLIKDNFVMVFSKSHCPVSVSFMSFVCAFPSISLFFCLFFSTCHSPALSISSIVAALLLRLVVNFWVVFGHSGMLKFAS